MALTNEDLQKIGTLIQASEKRLEKQFDERLDNRVTDLKEHVTSLEERLTRKIEDTKTEIITILGKEVSDLADINRAVITRTDELDHRLRIVERKLGIATK